jgi:hypothetical protein
MSEVTMLSRMLVEGFRLTFDHCDEVPEDLRISFWDPRKKQTTIYTRTIAQGASALIVLAYTDLIRNGVDDVSR